MKINKEIQKLYDNMNNLMKEIWEELKSECSNIDLNDVTIALATPSGQLHYRLTYFKGEIIGEKKEEIFEFLYHKTNPNTIASYYGYFNYDDNDIAISCSGVIAVNYVYILDILCILGYNVDIFRPFLKKSMKHEIGHYVFDLNFIGKTRKQLNEIDDEYQLKRKELHEKYKDDMWSKEFNIEYCELPSEKFAEDFSESTEDSRVKDHKFQMKCMKKSHFISDNDFIGKKYIERLNNYFARLVFDKHKEYFPGINTVTTTISSGINIIELLYDLIVESSNIITDDYIEKLTDEIHNIYDGEYGVLFNIEKEEMTFYINEDSLKEIFLIMNMDSELTFKKYKRFLTRMIEKAIKNNKKFKLTESYE